MNDLDPNRGMTFTDVLFRGGWRKSGGKFFLVLGLIAVVAVGAGVGVPMLLKAADQSVSAAQGYEYSGEGFRLMFLGEPTVTSESVPGVSAKVTLAEWSNKQKAYQVAVLPSVADEGTVEAMLQSSLETSGATLVESHPVSIAGGTGLAAHLAMNSAGAWSLMVIADDRSHALSILQTGDQRDNGFFDSLVLK